MVTSRRLEDLDPEVKEIAQEHIRLCRDAGIELLITSTWRDWEAQDALFAIGRTVHKERRRVTNARGGRSWHNLRCAWDVVPLILGKCDWKSRSKGNLTPFWFQIVTLGKQVGALAGADWPGKLVDDAHFYVTPDLTIEEASARFQSEGTIFAV